MRIEILYVGGCPHHAGTLALVREILDGAGIAAAIEEVEVRDSEMARAIGFLGSPSIRIDGQDIEPAMSERHDFGLSCRVYANAAGYSGIPARELILEALRVNTARNA